MRADPPPRDGTGGGRPRRLVREAHGRDRAEARRRQGPRGGASRREGAVSRKIREAPARAAGTDRKARVVVGVNRSVTEDPRPLPGFKPPSTLECRRGAEARAHRKRIGNRASRPLLALGRKARGKANLVPPILDCVNAGATLGQITSALEEAFRG